MGKKTFDEKPKKVLAASGIEIEKVCYCDPDYHYVRQRDSKATSTGWLELLRVEPIAKDSELPKFVARWEDERKTGQEAIDVDLVEPESERKAFELGLNGYRGHHSTSIVGKARTFEIDIAIPDSKPELACRNIFKARVSCAMVTRGRTLAADAVLKAEKK